MILIGLGFSLLAIDLPAGGQKEELIQGRLDEARRLIAEKQYVQAIELLSRIAREERDAFDEAQKLLVQIQAARNEYNLKYEQLLEKLRENDLPGSLRLIDELEALDPNPNEATLRALAQARRGTELVYNRIQFNELMDRARTHLQAGEYTQAMEVYLGGYSLQRESFDRAVDSNIVRAAVNRHVEAILAAGREFVDSYPSVREGLAELEKRLAQSGSGLPEDEARRMIARFVRTGGLSDSVRDRTLDLERQSRELARNQEEGDDLFLYFAVRLGFGRSWEVGVQGDPLPKGEGILTILEGRQTAWRDGLSATLRQAAGRSFSEGLDLLTRGRNEAALPAFDRAGRLYRLTAGALALGIEGVDPEADLALSDEAAERLGERLDELLEAQIRAAACLAYPELIRIRQYLTVTAAAGQPSLESYQFTRGDLQRQTAAPEALLDDWEQRLRRLERIPMDPGTRAGLQESVREVTVAVRAVLAALENADLRLAVRSADLQLQLFENDLSGLQARFEQARESTEGVERRQELRSEQGEVIETLIRLERYPSRALEILQLLPDGLTGLSERVAAFLRSWDLSDAYFQDDAEVRQRRMLLVELRGRIESLRSAAERTRASAADHLARALRSRQEGELRIREARDSLRQNQFLRAKEALANASRALDRSLEHQEDAEVRRMRDTELLAVSGAIVQAEHDQVIQEVLGLVRQGQGLYKAARYTEAERVLLRAKSRWADTNTEENPEVNTWLALTRNALSARSGWDIPETDPLYQNYSQLYSLAMEDHQEGRRLLEARLVRDARERLKAAEVKTQLILNMFPRNLQTRLLSLRITQIQDPEGFPRKIDSLYREALDTIRRGDLQEAYSLLKSLEEVQPNYPGLKERIVRIEEDLGIRQRPLPQASLRESDQLTRQAREIVARGRRAELESALAQVNRALELNPDNQPALSLKYTILGRLGGDKELVLPAEVDLRMKLAEEKLLAGNLFEALAVVNELEKKYPNIVAIKELKRRIESRLFGGTS